MENLIDHLIQLNQQANLDSLPEVQAMKQVIRSSPGANQDSLATLCVAAGLNDYQEAIRANPDEDSYWGRFVRWAMSDGQGAPPWRRFPNIKARRFERFRSSQLWKARLLQMDSGQVRMGLAVAMGQHPFDKTVCFAPLVLARLAYVLGRPFTVVASHPIPIDSRISRLLERVPGLDPFQIIQQANEARRKLGRPDLNMSDFDAWAWQENGN